MKQVEPDGQEKAELRSLLLEKQSTELYSLCADALLREDVIFESFPRDMEKRQAQEIYTTRCEIAREVGHVASGYETLLPNLQGHVGGVRLYGLTTGRQHYTIFTDAALSTVLGIVTVELA